MADGEAKRSSVRWNLLDSTKPCQDGICNKCWSRIKAKNFNEGNGNFEGRSCEVCSAGDIDVCKRNSDKKTASSSALLEGRYLCKLCVTHIRRFEADPPACYWDDSIEHPCEDCGTLLSTNWVTSVDHTP